MPKGIINIIHLLQVSFNVPFPRILKAMVWDNLWIIWMDGIQEAGNTGYLCEGEMSG